MRRPPPSIGRSSPSPTIGGEGPGGEGAFYRNRGVFRSVIPSPAFPMISKAS